MKRTAAILLALLTLVGPARAMIVSPKVGPLLKEAQTLLLAKDYKGAMAKLDEAEVVKSNAVDDETVINQMRQAVEMASSHPSQP